MEKIAEFSFDGRPLIQKNNIKVRYRKVGGKKIPFIGHSKEFSEYREAMTHSYYQQYLDQGFEEPIDEKIEIVMNVFVERRSVGDIDNYPSASLDALQGIKTGRKKTDRVEQVLTDDKLVHKLTVERFIKGDPGYDGEPRVEFVIYRYKEASEW